MRMCVVAMMSLVWGNGMLLGSSRVVDVRGCYPRLVQIGLDLIDFPTLVWFEAEFFVFQSTEKGAVLLGVQFGYNRV